MALDKTVHVGDYYQNLSTQQKKETIEQVRKKFNESQSVWTTNSVNKKNKTNEINVVQNETPQKLNNSSNNPSINSGEYRAKQKFVKEVLDMSLKDKGLDLSNELKPEIIIKKDPSARGSYSIDEGTFTINSDLIEEDPEFVASIVGHETTHLKQFIDMARLPGGTEKIKEALKKRAARLKELPYVKAVIEKDESYWSDIDSKTGKPRNMGKHQDLKKRIENLGIINDEAMDKFYGPIVEKLGPLDPNSKEAKEAEKILDFIRLNDLKDFPLDASKNYKNDVEKGLFYIFDYKNNPLESPAYDIEKKVLKNHKKEIARAEVELEGALSTTKQYCY